MNAILPVNGIDIMDVVNNIDNYPDEVIAAALEYGRGLASNLREVTMRLEGNLLTRMKADNATKIVFRDNQGGEKVATLKKGSMKCDEKNADEVYKKYGFDPLEIGEHIFKPSWTKAKEVRKLGGDKQLVIDELFKEGKESITFND